MGTFLKVEPKGSLNKEGEGDILDDIESSSITMNKPEESPMKKPSTGLPSTAVIAHEDPTSSVTTSLNRRPDETKSLNTLQPARFDQPSSFNSSDYIENEEINYCHDNANSRGRVLYDSKRDGNFPRRPL
ncbi:hypothetical protein PENTCL1PPCAC_24007 [Pristionchus entomophagus]|uniref:Uncharacterized protein n=1 Tax=Pristionchus entomophagus TaxID=358040 RepID=A0AAV5U5C8_9BILA|nr:hypothetical protein PENTCL1PPCAC_24007 [Pristionchus entomophagus]